MIKIQCSIIGFDNHPATVFSVYEPESKVLAVARIEAYQRKRQKGFMVITNDTGIDRDSLFTEQDLKPAINAYFSMIGGVAIDGKSSRLKFSDTAVRSTPTIEKDGVDESGTKYRISEGVTCSQIAVLATSLYCGTRAESIESALNFMDDLAVDLSNFGVGDILSI